MNCPKGRSVESEVDFNSEGNGYFSRATYVDTGEECSEEVLDYLNEVYAEELYDAEREAYWNRVDADYERTAY